MSAPGTGPTYSNPNFLLLGMLIEQVTGSPLAEAYRADLFEPAGLERVAVQDTERPMPPLAVPPKHLHIEPADGYLPCRSTLGRLPVRIWSAISPHQVRHQPTPTNVSVATGNQEMKERPGIRGLGEWS